MSPAVEKTRSAGTLVPGTHGCLWASWQGVGRLEHEISTSAGGHQSVVEVERLGIA